MLNRQPSNNVALEGAEKRLDELEAQIRNLEVELMALQDSEVQRRLRAIANRQEETARASLSSSAILVDNSVMFTARESMSPLTTGTTGGTEKEDQSMLALVTDYNKTDGGGKEEPPTLAVVANNAAEDYDAADRKVKEKPPTAVVAANNDADKKVEERTLADILKDPRERERIASGLKKESEQWKRPPHDGRTFVLDIFRLCIECNEVPSTIEQIC